MRVKCLVFTDRQVASQHSRSHQQCTSSRSDYGLRTGGYGCHAEGTGHVAEGKCATCSRFETRTRVSGLYWRDGVECEACCIGCRVTEREVEPLRRELEELEAQIRDQVRELLMNG